MPLTPPSEVGVALEINATGSNHSRVLIATFNVVRFFLFFRLVFWRAIAMR
jgi:hypothetical protein